MSTDKPNKRKGFATMSPKKQREIASMGGKVAHEKGAAHRFSSEQAREAGRKGGLSVSANRQHMGELARKAAEARKRRPLLASEPSSPEAITKGSGDEPTT